MDAKVKLFFEVRFFSLSICRSKATRY